VSASDDNVQVVVGLDSKELRLFAVEAGSFTPVGASAKATKKPTALAYAQLIESASASRATGVGVIVLGDKGGDATAFPAENLGSRSRWLLGHTGSIVSDVAMSSDGHYLLTADRDEKIRVSLFPFADHIAAFCLGHTRFVSTIRLLHFGASGYGHGELLLSGGGDGTVRVWHWRSGTLLHTLYLLPQPDNAVYAGWASRTRQPAGAAHVAASAALTVHDPSRCSDVHTAADGAAVESYAAIGAHADLQMNNAPTETEFMSGSGDDGGAAADADDDPSREESAAETDEAPEGTASGASTVVASPVNQGPIVPVTLVEDPRNGLIATFLEGDSSVKLLRIARPSDDSTLLIAAAPGHTGENPGGFPQARVKHVGTVRTATPVLGLSFLPPTPGAEDSSNGSTSILVIGTARPAFSPGAPSASSPSPSDWEHTVTCISITFQGVGAPEIVSLPASEQPSAALNSFLSTHRVALRQGLPSDAAELRGALLSDAIDEYDRLLVRGFAHTLGREAANGEAGADSRKRRSRAQ
jgi:hypothetical protein